MRLPEGVLPVDAARGRDRGPEVGPIRPDRFGIHADVRGEPAGRVVAPSANMSRRLARTSTACRVRSRAHDGDQRRGSGGRHGDRLHGAGAWREADRRNPDRAFRVGVARLGAYQRRLPFLSLPLPWGLSFDFRPP